VRSRSNAAPVSRPAKWPARSTKALVIWRGISRKVTPTSPPAVSERRSRCCRASQAHPEARSASPSRAKRSPRRVPARRHRPEPSQDGQTSPDAGPGSERLRLRSRLSRSRQLSASTSNALFNAISVSAIVKKRCEFSDQDAPGLGIAARRHTQPLVGQPNQCSYGSKSSTQIMHQGRRSAVTSVGRICAADAERPAASIDTHMQQLSSIARISTRHARPPGAKSPRPAACGKKVQPRIRFCGCKNHFPVRGRSLIGRHSWGALMANAQSSAWIG
jgi:hypothetical protein